MNFNDEEDFFDEEDFNNIRNNDNKNIEKTNYIYEKEKEYDNKKERRIDNQNINEKKKDSADSTKDMTLNNSITKANNDRNDKQNVNDHKNIKTSLNSTNECTLKYSSLNVGSDSNSEKDEINDVEYSNETKEILKEMRDGNGDVKNSLIISMNPKIYEEITISLVNKIINKKYSQYKSQKILYIVSDAKYIDIKIKELSKKLSGKNIMNLKSKKNKNFKTMNELIQNTVKEADILITNPNVLYNYLIFGYLKIYDFPIIFLEEFESCSGSHPYYSIILEFYYYYIGKNIEKGNKLPTLIGYTKNLYVSLKNMDKNKAIELLTMMSENINGQIIIDPKLIKNTDINTNKNRDQIIEETINIQKNNDNLNNRKILNGLIAIIMKYFSKPFIKLCIKNYLYGNYDMDNNITNQKLITYKNVENIKILLLENTKKKLLTENYSEYTIIDNSDQKISKLNLATNLFKIYEKTLKIICELIQNFGYEEIYNFFKVQKDIYENLLLKCYEQKFDDSDDILSGKIKEKELLKLYEIFASMEYIFDKLKNKAGEFNNDRKIKFEKSIDKIISEYYNDKKEINDISIIVVGCHRIINYELEIFFKEKYNEKIKKRYNYELKFNCVYGSSKNKENTMFYMGPKMSQKEQNTKINQFIQHEVNILVCSFEQCKLILKNNLNKIHINGIIFFNEPMNNKDYVIYHNNLLLYHKNNLSNGNIYFHILTHKKDIITTNNNDNIITDNNNDTKSNILTSIFNNSNICINYCTNKEYIQKQLNKINQEYMLLINNTQAKASLKNINIIINELFNQLNLNKTSEYEKSFKSKTEGGVFFYTVTLKFIGYFKNIIKGPITSDEQKDKQTAENDCLIKFLSILKQKGYIDDNFKYINKTT